MSRTRASGAVFLTSVIFSFQLQAGVLARRDLGGLAHDAAAVFVGTCVSAEPGATQQVAYVEYTFRVQEWIKGGKGRLITFRQARALPRYSRSFATADDSLFRAPVYVVGQKYLLYLYPEDKFGLTSPVGAVQGSFVVRTFPDGEEIAINGINNLGLNGPGKGPARLSEIVPMTRRLLR